ncbi:MAG: hypothetical protein ABRQ37_11165 [Candidatus Eremiobacterota bacterium]
MGVGWIIDVGFTTGFTVPPPPPPQPAIKHKITKKLIKYKAL